MFSGEYKGLTRIEVEALKECFDFIANGYQLVVGYHDDKQWFVKLRHLRRYRYLRVYIHKWYYTIQRDFKCVKSVSVNPDDYRYDVLLDSGVQIKRTYTAINGCEKLVFGSVLPNNNA